MVYAWKLRYKLAVDKLRRFESELVFESQEDEEYFKSHHHNLHMLRTVMVMMAVFNVVTLISTARSTQGFSIYGTMPFFCAMVMGGSYTDFYKAYHEIILAIFIGLQIFSIIAVDIYVYQTKSNAYVFSMFFVYALDWIRFKYLAPLMVLYHIIMMIVHYTAAYTMFFHPFNPSLLVTSMFLHTFLLVVYFMNERIARNNQILTKELRDETKKAEMLLLNALPYNIAKQSKRGEFPIATKMQEACLVWVDIWLDEIWDDGAGSVILSDITATLDRLCINYGLEKMKGFRGDEYVCTSSHSSQCARFSLDASYRIHQQVRKVAMDNYGRESDEIINLRIGLSLGELYGGIIGSERVTYDYWGILIQEARCIVSQSHRNSITVTDKVYLDLFENFSFVPNQMIRIPSEALHPSFIQTYLLTTSPLADGVVASYINSDPIPLRLLKACSSLESEAYSVNSSDDDDIQKLPFNWNPYTLIFYDKQEEEDFTMWNIRSELWKIRLAIFFYGLTVSLDCAKRTLSLTYGFTDLILALGSWMMIMWTFTPYFIKFHPQIFLFFINVYFSLWYIICGWSPTIILFQYLLCFSSCQKLLVTHIFCTIYLISVIVFFILSDEVALVTVYICTMIITMLGGYKKVRNDRKLYKNQINTMAMKAQVDYRLNAIVPPSVASKLREGSTNAIVYTFKDIGLGCAYITNLEQIAGNISFTERALLLHTVHKEIDSITHSLLVDKIKTLANYTVVAAGLPTSANHNQVIDWTTIAIWALRVREEALSLHLNQVDGGVKDRFGVDMEMRIIIHKGDVFAGVIGSNRFRFDLWGRDMEKLQQATENMIPSEISSSKLPINGIFVTEEAYDYLLDDFRFSSNIFETQAGKMFELVGMLQHV
eukprot:TRINITY_DN2370_c0_g1_i1.p1 TRINITY_DN2370_c0_g1~~TRINITY_DN2370_c0_g1_i1.p1  ORF type:complete len:882 (-),score=169.99 TRINITY_DN2370_c0_g1_i1:641-3286(-)